MESKWKAWAKELQAISQAGTTYSKDKFDIQRFEELGALSEQIADSYYDIDTAKWNDLFESETGVITPKLAVRGVVLQENKLLLVKEKADGRWSLPGGWTDIGLSAQEVIVKEIKEESGFIAEAVRLLGVIDTQLHQYPPTSVHVYVVIILCEITGKDTMDFMETEEIGFFERDKLPPLSPTRNTEELIEEIFELLAKENQDSLLD
ncbi:NUDIX hydrolase [Gracilibacillus alcaliphilus]|uniref:NUDIX hydrolase n=1 Tax=Gracilibacillus alcaliphilus TaxID=1401441 RepID=UPI00195D463B|nr:NUDIX hydrolase [Gracilibacillus alcaliphilus]MBM7679143.1 ADP-ribose pyrophosphatase YjhB (NUDIX family) [Gracilibacillus alcaliphilus]